ncbi:hypothetical protein A3C59_03110 [Candidatus Daviesbacteria bacterium RIFCSPHIGHO2_02_FULL_36_13]|uniref:Fimbrial assembly protein n=1 Tax=Candidatus Daviesbacteria bacterium RIFCSPHIGHO2_02_FULL_36_13 TaxID=1797768 RepID=A0A1F5JQ43_9BACT|nr:MAG: hypothetical protein A3C59_03110 [Candidatus Daviesbacteria bacterium RIFCSPHIGHO2_02_FULL_36_13]
MAILINLLPIEFKQENTKKAKFYKIQKIGITTILAVVFLSSLTVALRILQSQGISNITTEVTQVQAKISNLKDTEDSLFVIKNRLTTINQYLGISSKPTEIYDFVSKLLPSSMAINSINVENSGEISILASSSDIVPIDNLVDQLLYTPTNQNKISSVSIDSLSKGRDGIYRISFRVKPK